MSPDPDLRARQQAALDAVKPDLDAGAAALKAGNAAGATECFMRAVERMPAELPVRGLLVQETLTASRQAFDQAMAGGGAGAAQRFLKIALDLPELIPNAEPALRQARAEQFSNWGQMMFSQSRFGDALALLRKALSSQRRSVDQLHLSNALTCTGEAARLSDFTDRVAPDQLAPKLMIACLPKSGSSFLNNVVQKLTGWPEVVTYPPCGQFEQELYTPALIEFAMVPAVVQQHCRATDANLQILQGFSVKPVVLVRNIEDALLSLLEFYRSGASFQTVFHPDFGNLDAEQQADLLIEHRAPWYFEFVASWLRADQDGRLPVLWLRYEDMVADKPAAIRRIADHWNIEADDERIASVLAEAEAETGRNRFNVGKVGRGREQFTEAQRARIAALAENFPSLDLSIVGAPRQSNSTS